MYGYLQEAATPLGLRGQREEKESFLRERPFAWWWGFFAGPSRAPRQQRLEPTGAATVKSYWQDDADMNHKQTKKGPLLSPFFPPVSLSRAPYWQNLAWNWPKGTEVCSIPKAASQSRGQEGGFELGDSSLGTDTAAKRRSFWKLVSTVLGIHLVNVPRHWCSLAGLSLLFLHTEIEPHVPLILSFPNCFLLMWRRAWQPTPVFLLENPMDRGAWRATVQEAAKSHTWLSDWPFHFSWPHYSVARKHVSSSYYAFFYFFPLDFVFKETLVYNII